MNKYQEWIETHHKDPRKVLSKCAEVTKEMLMAFPELIRTNGFILLFGEEKERMHWWLKTVSGEVIDPTAHQYDVFQTKIINYREIDDQDPARLYKQSKCMNCGEYYYITPGLKYMHNAKCEKEFSDYMNGE